MSEQSKEQIKTPEQIIADCNALAARFYKLHGYEVPSYFKFYSSQHPQELAMLGMACIAYEELNGTEMSDVLLELGIEIDIDI